MHNSRNKLTQEIVEKAKKIIKETKEHRPLALMFNEKEQYVVPCLFDDQKSKERCQKALRTLVEEKNITHYYVIMEGWMSEQTMEEPVIPPSRNINRKEVLFIAGFSKDNPKGENVTIQFTRENGEIVFGEERTAESIETPWNFYLEDTSDQRIEEDRRKRIVHHIENTDFTPTYETMKKTWEKEKGTPFPLSKEQTKKMVIKLTKEGYYKKGIIPTLK